MSQNTHLTNPFDQKINAPTVEALGDAGKAFLSVFQIRDGIGTITLDIDTSNIGTRPWDPEMIHDTAFYIPAQLISAQNKILRYNFTVDQVLQNHTDILSTQENNKDPWSYMNWAIFATEVETQQYPIISAKLNYYSALFNVTDKYGRPIDGSFMIFIKNLIPVPPPEDLNETPEPTQENLITADRGYAYWILLIRLVIKNSPFDTQSTMLASLNNFIKFDIVTVRNNIGALVDALKSEFQIGQRLTQSNSAARHGMNYSIYHELKWTRDNINKIIDNAGRQVNDWVVDEHSRIVKQMSCFKLYANSNDIPRFHSGFWAFCDIGIKRHGWSAVEMMERGLDNHNLTWNDIFIAFPTKEMITFIGTVKIEKQLCSTDFWRDTSHLLAPDINTPLSASKNHIAAYIGKCLNEPNLSPNDLPPCLPGTEIIDDLKIIIVKKVIALIIQNYTETLTPNLELLKELRLDIAKVERVQQVADTLTNKVPMTSVMDRLRQAQPPSKVTHVIGKYDQSSSGYQKIPVPSLTSDDEGDDEFSKDSESLEKPHYQDN